MQIEILTKKAGNLVYKKGLTIEKYLKIFIITRFELLLSRNKHKDICFIYR